MGSGHPARCQPGCLGNSGEVGADEPLRALPQNAADQTAGLSRATPPRLLCCPPAMTTCLGEAHGLRREDETGLLKAWVVAGPPVLHAGASVATVLSSFGPWRGVVERPGAQVEVRKSGPGLGSHTGRVPVGGVTVGPGSTCRLV